MPQLLEALMLIQSVEKATGLLKRVADLSGCIFSLQIWVRSVPSYSFGGTLSISGAIWAVHRNSLAMRSSRFSTAHRQAAHKVFCTLMRNLPTRMIETSRPTASDSCASGWRMYRKLGISRP